MPATAARHPSVSYPLAHESGAPEGGFALHTAPLHGLDGPSQAKSSWAVIETLLPAQTIMPLIRPCIRTAATLWVRHENGDFAGITGKRKIRVSMALQTTLRAFQAFQRTFIGVNRRSSAADKWSLPRKIKSMISRR